MPPWGGIDGGGTDAPGWSGGRIGGLDGAGTEGAGAPYAAAGGGGVGAPAGPPIFWRRDLRSILGFLSSAIVRARDLTCGRAAVSTKLRRARARLPRHF